MALHVFPPTVTQPRKSSLKKPRSGNTAGAPGELKGVAFQVNTTRTSPAVVQPGNQQIKHSLFCEPRTATPDIQEAAVRVDTPLMEEEDELSALPENTSFGKASSQNRLKPGPERPKLPILISTEAQPDTDTPISPGGDGLSPLPHKTRFTPTSPSRTEFPMARSVISNSPTLVQDESPETAVPPYSPNEALASGSLFPRYDHRKPLDQQNYYPKVRSTTPTLPREKVSKVRSNSDEKKPAFPILDMKNVETCNTVVVGYEHIPIAKRSDLHAVCNASCGNFPVAGRKALFRLIQPQARGTSLGIGLSPDALLYSMDKSSPSSPSKRPKASNELHIKKHSPEAAASFCTVAQLALPDSDESNNPDGNDVVSIFPQMAAFNAIETISNSPVGSEIARVDPIAASPEAARMAQDAVWEAHRRYRSLLVRTTRKRDSLGAVTATYKLEHPTLNAFPMTVTKSTNGRNSRDPRAKISLHHPSATPAAVAAETLVLGFLDFANDACVLDVPGLLALEGSYVLDTVICALLAVAVVENDAIMAESIKFDPPPKSPQPPTKRGSRNEVASSKNSKRSSGFWKRDKKKKEVVEDEFELPGLTKGALMLLGMSFKMAIWTLEMSAKIGVGLIVATTEVIRENKSER